MKRFLILLCLALSLLLLVGCQKNPGQVVVGDWQSAEVFDPGSGAINELPSDYAALRLRADGTGDATVSGQSFSLKWSYVRTDEDGALVFDCTVDGAPSRMYYKPAYSQVWLYTGDYMLMYERAK